MKWLLTLVLGAFVSCSSSSFTSSEQKPTPEPLPETTPETKVAVAQPAQTIEPKPTQPVSTPRLEVKEKVDGQEVVRDCRECLRRAREIARDHDLDWRPSMSRTVNKFFFKIPRRQNLCDIHFLETEFETNIALHDGADTVFHDQIILYCPCDCDWAYASADDEGDL